MKLRIEIEIPTWTRWVAIGLTAGLVLGLGIARVMASTPNLKSNWNTGEVLRASELNQNFQNIQTAFMEQQTTIAALTSSDCPTGYTRDSMNTSDDAGPANIVVCKRYTDEVVRVGTGGATFWIDRYEASVWTSPSGSGTQYGTESGTAFPSSFPADGQYTSPLYAVSQTNNLPTSYLTWFQADAACEASGKRLPNREEWLRAARGTYDPGSSDGANGRCVTHGSTRNTGNGVACVSRWGAQDMIGNLWEWTAEWYASVAAVEWGPVKHWSADLSGSDGIWGVTSSAFENGSDTVDGVPVATVRGGSYVGMTNAGIFAMLVQIAPSNSNPEVGFRCVMLR